MMHGIREADLPRNTVAGGVAAYRSWRDIRGQAYQAALSARMTVILGAPGLGKSLLLRELQQMLLVAGRTVLLLRRGNLGHAEHSEVILIDEAELLTRDHLAALARSGRACVLVGATALGDRLAGLKPPPLVLQLHPLALEETAEFVAALQAQSKQPAEAPSPAAIGALWRLSSGMPGRLSLLFGLATFLARLADAPRITEAHATEAGLIQGDANLPDEDVLPDGDLADGDLAEQSAAPAALERPAAAVLPGPRAVPGWRPVVGLAAALLGELATGGPVLLAALTFLQSGPPSQVAGGTSSHRAFSSSQAPAAGPSSVPSLAAPAVRPPAETASAADADGPEPTEEPAPLPPPLPEQTATSQVPGGRDTALPPTQFVPDLAGGGVPAAPEGAQLPDLPRLAITVLVLGGDAAAEQSADQLIGTIRQLGLGTPPRKATVQRLEAAAITYFFEEDAPRVADLARLLGGVYGAARLASRVPVPRPGTVEITLPAGAPLPGAQTNPPTNEPRRRLRGRS